MKISWMMTFPIYGKIKAMFQTTNQVPSHQVTIPERLELRLDGVAASSSGGGGACGTAGAGPGVADMARGARTRPCWGDLVGNLWKPLEKEGFSVGLCGFYGSLPIKM